MIFPFQIGSLKNYFHFHHRHVSKRSVSTSDVYVDALNAEPEVSYIYILFSHIFFMLMLFLSCAYILFKYIYNMPE